MGDPLLKNPKTNGMIHSENEGKIKNDHGQTLGFSSNGSRERERQREKESYLYGSTEAQQQHSTAQHGGVDHFVV